jgi:hypothetical protein
VLTPVAVLALPVSLQFPFRVAKKVDSSFRKAGIGLLVFWWWGWEREAGVFRQVGAVFEFRGVFVRVLGWVNGLGCLVGEADGE